MELQQFFQVFSQKRSHVAPIEFSFFSAGRHGGLLGRFHRGQQGGDSGDMVIESLGKSPGFLGDLYSYKMYVITYISGCWFGTCFSPYIGNHHPN